MNVFQLFDTEVPNDELFQHMSECREATHKWGKLNRVTFDAAKEHLIIIHPIFASGDPFKLLGCLVDCKLQMLQAIDNIITQVRPKMWALLRTRAHYDLRTLVNQFKTHLWGLMEIHNGAIFHAATTHLNKLDSLQRHFLHELDIPEEDAFMRFNFAPPSVRRDIGILGLLHKRVLGKAHPVYQKLLPFHNEVFGSLNPALHRFQLYGHSREVLRQHNLFDRSIFAMVYVYNRLPLEILECPTVTCFQKQLTCMVREACKVGDDRWKLTFNSRVPRYLD